MGTLETAKALVFIAKAIINLILYMQGMIKRHEYESRISEMSKAIEKATTGDLDGRLEGGAEVEDMFNQNTKR
jgi:hypothetical protein